MRMPAEWEPHERCLIAWPARESLWGDRLDAARDAHAAVVRAGARFEPVWVLARPQDAADARLRCGDFAEVVEIPLDDSWVRDTGPLCVRDDDGSLVGVDFAFNGWGEKYVPYDEDARLAARLLEMLGLPRREVRMVLEGGSIGCDGRGTFVTTESALLNPNRNPGLTREEAERVLAEALGAERVIWLRAGLAEDRDTDGHVDNVCQFIGPGRVLAQTVPAGNPNHAVLSENVQRLRDAGLEVVEVPWLPYVQGDPPVAAPYVNLYQANGAAIVPASGAPEDELARELLERAMPGREIVMVDGVVLALGGGGVHCITLQQPAAGGGGGGDGGGERGGPS